MNSVDLIKKICKERKIPISHLERDLGYGNGYISQLRKGTVPSDRAVEIANYLNIDLQYLLSGGEDINENKNTLTRKDTRDIEKILNETKEQLLSQDGLMFEGDPASPEAIESILSAMQIGVEMAKKKNKEIFTPKKYKKD
ncbi:helix-turn-helix domain-containing protein [Lacrimispora sp.]|uniref:helix-turn-helix domain-containing protein n=1 Tax=Lacrimispora sp. TaxID=2719234 RepID=UPI0028B1BA2B|nr:XRE family transcriptional regulator [Lacrimispora sp.]